MRRRSDLTDPVEIAVAILPGACNDPKIREDQQNRLRQLHRYAGAFCEVLCRERLLEVVGDELHVILPPVDAHLLDKRDRDAVITVASLFFITAPAV